MHNTTPVLAPIFFVLFVFFVYFVLLSMFLAIMNHAYGAVMEMASQFGHQLSLGGYIFAVFLAALFVFFVVLADQLTTLYVDDNNIYYLRQVNEVNSGDKAFVRCVSVCLFVCLCAAAGHGS